MATLGDDLLGTVNKLQDLVFNTIGNDSLDLPQIVRSRSVAIVLLAGTNIKFHDSRSSSVHSRPASPRF